VDWSGLLSVRSGGRRDIGRAAAAIAAAALLVAGCGRGGHGAETDPEKGSDVATLNAFLGHELTTLAVYTRGGPLLRGSMRPVGRRLRAQEQEYVDALTKAIRGLGGTVEAEPEEVDLSGVRGQAALLAMAYGLENDALASYVDAAPRLFTAAPRTLDASLAAGHAQHLVVLRQGLGASRAASVPTAFGAEEMPPQGGSGPVGGG
jgi:Ferritin-like domain